MTKLNELSTGVNALRTALGVTVEPSGLVAGGIGAGGIGNQLQNLHVENLMAERMIVQSPPVVVNNVSDNSTVNAPVGIRHGAGGGVFSLDPRDTMQFFLQ
jgi:hypothetical protein